MKRSDLKTDVVYAVAIYTESHPLGASRGLRPCVVVSTDKVPRNAQDNWDRHTVNDGVAVRDAYRDGKRYMVRPQAIKGTWDEHLRLVREREAKQRVERERRTEARNRFYTAVDRLRAEGVLVGVGVTDDTPSHRYAKLHTEDIEALLDRLQETDHA